MAELQEAKGSQRRELASIANFWKPLGPIDYGQHDVVEYLARSRGWNPLVVGESMSVGIAGRRYEIRRVG